MKEFNRILSEYEAFKAKGLNLNMSRGAPSSEQLDSMERLLTAVTKNNECFSEKGTDCRNYGALDGINETKRLFAEMLGVDMLDVIVGGNSSLNLMYDTIARAMLHGVEDDCKPWSKYEKISFLCPVPGYDRHFAICEYFGINMIVVPMNNDGPDMDMIEKLVSEDETIKGCWCVPKYSNPSGITFSDEVVTRFAKLKPKAKDFRVFWDNAYVLHDLTDTPDTLLEIFTEAKKYGNEDMFYEFASTSKITYAGGGIACIASSRRNINRILEELKIQTIGHDKVNQLRHARIFRTYSDIVEQMYKHLQLIRPKFEVFYRIFSEKLSGYPNVSWTKPNGGYFICLNLPKNTAKRVAQLAKEAGLILTPAGATHPYGRDPEDSILRIAPTFPSVAELEVAVPLLCSCIELVIFEKNHNNT
ncbi:MAG: aminotransferase class I/II-fold pyridoxal phosphate-dependent enzyme [Eubacteriales bacterium]|nr:aminotransferase class I/II-fold pyridoxal phosphate-dependent enzyme [Eubacteriales bacterium]MDD4422048.1 aminotransferase class I/II-fold pyridoxal phosphate-dependent enzyme [Eubacteriales bacterium]HBR30887.1 aminotransferase [Clostridiales bacterium]